MTVPILCSSASMCAACALSSASFVAISSMVKSSIVFSTCFDEAIASSDFLTASSFSTTKEAYSPRNESNSSFIDVNSMTADEYLALATSSCAFAATLESSAMPCSISSTLSFASSESCLA
ncbi:hypothetical protein VIGAN_03270900 [Vigna angularis var. angularis]|uniref:Secreted protein n=1 Tax=Vigna angularis var. angularis TaxID=157739 RepID=A0A0S3RPX2_PHAAN|nr:hypothetical protein VIGAN_03270900 [Vigna angularis var. angularis]